MPEDQRSQDGQRHFSRGGCVALCSWLLVRARVQTPQKPQTALMTCSARLTATSTPTWLPKPPVELRPMPLRPLTAAAEGLLASAAPKKAALLPPKLPPDIWLPAVPGCCSSACRRGAGDWYSQTSWCTRVLLTVALHASIERVPQQAEKSTDRSVRDSGVLTTTEFALKIWENKQTERYLLLLQIRRKPHELQCCLVGCRGTGRALAEACCQLLQLQRQQRNNVVRARGAWSLSRQCLDQPCPKCNRVALQHCTPRCALARAAAAAPAPPDSPACAAATSPALPAGTAFHCQ